jgi:hypothetical protein
MGKGYTLTGEESLREMIRLEDERRRRLTMSNRYGSIGGRSLPSNVVSLQDYRQRRAERLPRNPPPKRSA